MFFFFLGARQVFESLELERFAHALDVVQRRCPGMSLGQLSTLLHIGMAPVREGQCVSVSDIVATTPGQRYSTVARQIDLLGDGAAGSAPGMGLVEKQVDPGDRRTRYVAVSEKGKILLQELDLILSPDIVRTIGQPGPVASDA